MRQYGALCLMMVCLPAFAYEAYGICNHGKENLSTVVCYGPTVLKETTVAGEIKVTGPLRAYDVTSGGVNVVGSVSLEKSMVKGRVVIVGPFSAQQTDFVGDMDMTSNEAVLSQTKVRGSIVLHSSQTEPHLKLQCGTIVTGSVTFADKPGIVEVTDDSIVQGKVVNGDIAFVKMQCPQ